MKRIIGTAVFLAFLTSGCLQSLHPLYSSRDVVFDSTLVGSWTDKKEGNTWTFEKGSDNTYAVTYTEQGVPSNFQVHLVKLGSRSFLDFFPVEPHFGNDFYKIHLIPAHTFARVWISSDTIRLALLDHDWFKSMVLKQRRVVSYQILNERYVLTARTRELQQFVRGAASLPEAWSQPLLLVRAR